MPSGVIRYESVTNEDLAPISALLHGTNGDDFNLILQDLIVAKDGDEVVGCIRIKALEDGTRELASLVVAPDYRKKGIGRSLVSNVLETCNFRPIYLLCSEENAPFYAISGFAEIEPADLPGSLSKEYERIIKLPFAQSIKVVAMEIS